MKTASPAARTPSGMRNCGFSSIRRYGIASTRNPHAEPEEPAPRERRQVDDHEEGEQERASGTRSRCPFSSRR